MHVANVTGPKGLAGSSPAPSAIIAYAIYCLLQIADGSLTYVGVHRLGITAEANPIIRYGFSLFGIGATILWVKSGAMFVPLVLPKIRLAWVVLWLANLLYALIAVVPWVWLLWFS